DNRALLELRAWVVKWGGSLLAFGKIVRYYDRVEPSSPVTLFMKCAEQMVGKSFADIVRVLTPDAVAMLVTISTPPDQNASS
ncbi:MAG TPA: hypothetical protein PKU91_08160, partial [Phycisphaerales bacterium]|nr:hypothetical protein [Phycisphaerales bacterium]